MPPFRSPSNELFQWVYSIHRAPDLRHITDILQR